MILIMVIIIIKIYKIKLFNILKTLIIKQHKKNKLVKKEYLNFKRKLKLILWLV